MAARINIKFVVALVAVAAVIAIVVGGIYYIQINQDATRNITAGKQALAEGNIPMAIGEFAQAVNKDPGRSDYVVMLREALMMRVPETQQQALEYYTQLLRVYQHEALHHANDPDAHLPLLEEFRRASAWGQLADAAEDMYNRVPSTEPDRILAKLYRGYALVGYSAQLDPTLTDEEVKTGETDLLEFVGARPENDMGWAALATAQLAIANRYAAEGEPQRAQDKFVDEVEVTLRQGEEAVPDGPQLARAKAVYLVVRNGQRSDLVTREQVIEAVERMAALAHGSDDGRVVAEAAFVLRYTPWIDGINQAIELIQSYLARFPERYDLRSTLAQLQYENQDLDASEETSLSIINAEPIPTSYMSLLQWRLRERAYSQLFDVSYRRWEQTDPENPDRADLIAKAREARNKLAGYVSNAENNLEVIRADGLLALADNDISTALAKFEHIIRDGTEVTPEILIRSASCLERQGQIGLAQQRIEEAIELRPTNVNLWENKAVFELRMRRFAEAEESARKIIELDPESETGKRIIATVQSQGQGADPESANPVDRAQLALDNNDVDTARNILSAALADDPDNADLVVMLLQVELRGGQIDAARELLARAMELQPNNTRLQAMNVSLGNENPVKAVREYLKISEPDENLRTLLLLINLSELRRTNLEQITAGEAPEAELEKSQQIVSECDELITTLLAQAQQRTPDHPLLIEYLFSQALQNEDWETAQQLVDRAAESNLDQANGLLYRGRLQLQRGENEAAVVTLRNAVGLKPYSGLAWRALAYAYAQVGNLQEVERSLAASYECNPNDLETVKMYSATLVQLGKDLQALTLLRTARRLDPSDVQLREAWLELEGRFGDGAVALQRRREILQRLPDDRANIIRLALLLNSLEPQREDVRDSRGGEKYTALTWDAMRDSERAVEVDRVKKAWRAEATSLIDRTIEKDGADLQLLIVKAALLRSAGQVDEGEQALVDYAKALPDSPEKAMAYIALGDYFRQLDNNTDAYAAMQVARQFQSQENREAEVALGNLCLLENEYERAAMHYERVLEVSDNDLVRLRLIQCLEALGQLDEAEQRLEGYIAKKGRSLDTVLRRASIALQRANGALDTGDAAAARRQYERTHQLLDEAQVMAPTSTVPYLRRVQAFRAEASRTKESGLLNQAMLQLDRVDELAANLPQTSLARVEVLLQMGDMSQAIGELKRTLTAYPTNEPARRALIQLHAQAKEIDEAIEVAREGAELQPSTFLWFEALGDLYRELRQDYENAAPAYRKAYERRPTIGLLAKYIDSTLQTADPDCQFIVREIGQNEEAMNKNPVLRGGLAQAYDCLGDRENAIKQIKLAYQGTQALMDEGTLNAAAWRNWYVALERLFTKEQVDELLAVVDEATQGKPSIHDHKWLAWTFARLDLLDRAIESQKAAVAVDPGDNKEVTALLYFELAAYQLLAEKYADAVASYERVIELDPNNGSALNNLAYTLSEQLNEHSRAVTYAQRAAELLPKDPNTLDSLGWIYFRLSKFDQAEQQLRKSVELQEQPSALYHLARTLYQTGDTSSAELYLRRAAELRPDPKTQAEIDRLADDIRTGKAPAE